MFDIIFISYQEPNAETNWKALKERFPMAKRVHGVKGIHQAHIQAANKSLTKMFYAVDGDAEILDDFNFDYKVSEWDLDCVHVWRSKNPINNLEYGYGGVKLLPKTLTQKVDVTVPDMTTSISKKFKPIPAVSNITRFDTDPFNTWKSAFRECVKLASKTIDRQEEGDGQVDALGDRAQLAARYRAERGAKRGRDRDDDADSERARHQAAAQGRPARRHHGGGRTARRGGADGARGPHAEGDAHREGRVPARVQEVVRRVAGLEAARQHPEGAAHRRRGRGRQRDRVRRPRCGREEGAGDRHCGGQPVADAHRRQGPRAGERPGEEHGQHDRRGQAGRRGTRPRRAPLHRRGGGLVAADERARDVARPGALRAAALMGGDRHARLRRAADAQADAAVGG